LPPRSTQLSTLCVMVKWVPAKGRWCSATGKVTAGLVESNGSLPLGGWLIITCGLTACTLGSALGPLLGNEYGKPLPFFYLNGTIWPELCWNVVKTKPTNHPINKPTIYAAWWVLFPLGLYNTTLFIKLRNWVLVHVNMNYEDHHIIIINVIAWMLAYTNCLKTEPKTFLFNKTRHISFS